MAENIEKPKKGTAENPYTTEGNLRKGLNKAKGKDAVNITVNGKTFEVEKGTLDRVLSAEKPGVFRKAINMVKNNKTASLLGAGLLFATSPGRAIGGGVLHAGGALLQGLGVAGAGAGSLLHGRDVPLSIMNPGDTNPFHRPDTPRPEIPPPPPPTLTGR